MSYSLIAGVDEAGRGPLAGPVVAAAVVFPSGYANPAIKDSKQLSPKERERLTRLIKHEAVAWSIKAVGARRIEAFNIRSATRLAMSLAVRGLPADLVLVDGDMPIDTCLPQETIIDGDALRVEISAASILAKTYRDHLMRLLDAKYPGYGLAKHAGYPTQAHRQAIERLGPSRVHRRTFKGVWEYLEPAERAFPQYTSLRAARP